MLGFWCQYICLAYQANYCDEFFLYRTKEELSEMVCTLVIDAELLKNPLVYKYVVFSPQVTAPDECYEKLHSFNYDPNRCLWLSTEAYNKAYGGMQFPDQLLCVCVMKGCVRTVKVFAHQAYLLTSPGLK